jgi:hypothetical protein
VHRVDDAAGVRVDFALLPDVADAVAAFDPVAALDRADAERARASVDVADEDAAGAEATSGAREVADEIHALADLADREVAGEDDVGRMSLGIRRIADVAADELDAGDARRALEDGRVEVDRGRAPPGYEAHPRARKRRGAAEVLAERARIAAVELAEEADDLLRRLDRALVEVVTVERRQGFFASRALSLSRACWAACRTSGLLSLSSCTNFGRCSTASSVASERIAGADLVVAVGDIGGAALIALVALARRPRRPAGFRPDTRIPSN